MSISREDLLDFGYFVEPDPEPKQEPCRRFPPRSVGIDAYLPMLLDQSDAGATWVEIAREIGVSPQRARQICFRAVQKLRRRPEAMQQLAAIAAEYRKFRSRRENIYA